jgi:hypothetical protein
MTTIVEVNVDPALHDAFREVLRNVNKQASVAHLVAYVWEAAIIAETKRAASAAPEPTCKGCGGTIAQHTKMLNCRCDHTRFCSEYPNCSPPCHLSRVQTADRLHALAGRLLESADKTCDSPPQYRGAALFRILDEALPRLCR